MKDPDFLITGKDMRQNLEYVLIKWYMGYKMNQIMVNEHPKGEYNLYDQYK